MHSECGDCVNSYVSASGVIDVINAKNCYHSVVDIQSSHVSGVTFTSMILISTDDVITVYDGDVDAIRNGTAVLLASSNTDILIGKTFISYHGTVTIQFNTTVVRNWASSFSADYQTGCSGAWSVSSVSTDYLLSVGGQSLDISGEFHLPCTSDIGCKYGDITMPLTYVDHNTLRCASSPPWDTVHGTVSVDTWYFDMYLELIGDNDHIPSIPLRYIALPELHASPSPYYVSPGTVYITLHADHLASNVSCHVSNTSNSLQPDAVTVTYSNATLCVCRVDVSDYDVYMYLTNDGMHYSEYVIPVRSVPLPVIKRVMPLTFDAAGNDVESPLWVVGDNFVDIPDLSCVLNDTAVPATYYGAVLLSCVMPPSATLGNVSLSVRLNDQQSSAVYPEFDNQSSIVYETRPAYVSVINDPRRIVYDMVSTERIYVVVAVYDSAHRHVVTIDGQPVTVTARISPSPIEYSGLSERANASGYANFYIMFVASSLTNYDITFEVTGLVSDTVSGFTAANCSDIYDNTARDVISGSCVCDTGYYRTTTSKYCVPCQSGMPITWYDVVIIRHLQEHYW